MNQYQEKLFQKIESSELAISVIGLGYVGLPLALRFLEVGFQVYGIDSDERKIQAISTGKTYIKHIPSDKYDVYRKNGKFQATSNYEFVGKSDVIIICVPTPLTLYREPDLTYILQTMESLFPHLKKGQFICLESTTYPGTTEEVLQPYLTKSKLTCGLDAFLAFSPEREDPGNQKFTTQNIPKVVSGVTSSCREIAARLYTKIVDQVVEVSSTRTAEMTKLLENIHRAVNIGLVNEMKVVADKMGIDIYEVIRAAATKPFGFVPYYPGPGLGGHCIPIDPFYLTWKAREYGVHTKFIELAGDINSSMPNYVIEKIIYGLNKSEKSLKKSKIIVIGVAYKKNIDDLRESPSLFVIQKLLELGAEVFYHDPYISEFNEHGIQLKNSDLSTQLIDESDCVVVITDHDSIDYNLLLERSKLIIDTRGRYKSALEKVIRA
ncbi:UDP glucose 6-dehydrogenase [Leptospira ryugenii]|uniref:UDP glucose 6-dehydrogenase n=1 Tax=Leptospira ryugenii TaxID=1917863 RepID=A0A2P2DVY9_9LEPT|nr:nucleotide sugar dehydrogenase [Leptospira ryugenii]GBF48796.1 UDP glucose 6-dehydrogenase [Leptospira ryugenii]